MIPARTLEVLGAQQPVLIFMPNETYLMDDRDLALLETLMRRLGMPESMGADERRDWMNLLYTRLHHFT